MSKKKKKPKKLKIRIPTAKSSRALTTKKGKKGYNRRKDIRELKRILAGRSFEELPFSTIIAEYKRKIGDIEVEFI